MKLNELSHDQFKEMILQAVTEHKFESEAEEMECLEFVKGTLVSVTDPELFPEVINLFNFRFPYLAANIEAQVLSKEDAGLESILT